jgi:hypothetical protein
LNNYDEEYLQIYAHITDQPLYNKPPLGAVRKIDEMINEQKNDYINEKLKSKNLKNYSYWTVIFQLNRAS